MLKDMEQRLRYRSELVYDHYYFILTNGVGLDSPIADESDLVLVQFKGLVDTDDPRDYREEGIMIIGRRIIYDANNTERAETVEGVVAYESISGYNCIMTSIGGKARESYFNNFGLVSYRFVPIENLTDKLSLKYILSTSPSVKIAINVSGDVYFDNNDDANKYAEKIRFCSGKVSSDSVAVVINDNHIHYRHYDVFIGDEICRLEHNTLFDYLCQLSPSNEVKYNRVFKLDPCWIEIVNAKDACVPMT